MHNVRDMHSVRAHTTYDGAMNGARRKAHRCRRPLHLCCPLCMNRAPRQAASHTDRLNPHTTSHMLRTFYNRAHAQCEPCSRARPRQTLAILAVSLAKPGWIMHGTKQGTVCEAPLARRLTACVCALIMHEHAVACVHTLTAMGGAPQGCTAITGTRGIGTEHAHTRAQLAAQDQQ